MIVATAATLITIAKSCRKDVWCMSEAFLRYLKPILLAASKVAAPGDPSRLAGQVPIRMRGDLSAICFRSPQMSNPEV